MIRRLADPQRPTGHPKRSGFSGWPSEACFRQALRRLLAGYLIVSGLAFLFPHRPPLGLWWAAGHLAGAAALLGWGPLGGLGNRALRRWPRAFGVVSDWYALLLVPFLYLELASLNRAVHGGRYFDEVVLGLELSLFGSHPSQVWGTRFPHLLLSEVLHLCYLSYYFIIYLPPLYLYLEGRKAEHQGMIFSIMLAFLVHYVVFVFFPVQGPRYLFPSPVDPLARGWFFHLAHAVLEAGSAQGAAFPSSHVGVAMVQAALAWKWLPRAAPVVSLATLGLALGAVYGGFHYATDALAGGGLGLLLWALAPFAARKLAGRQPETSAGHPTPLPSRTGGPGGGM